jgi:hypothetical protein
MEPTGENGTADRSTCGRMGLGRACKEEISRMKTTRISIESTEVRKNMPFGLRKTVYW